MGPRAGPAVLGAAARCRRTCKPAPLPAQHLVRLLSAPPHRCWLGAASGLRRTTHGIAARARARPRHQPPPCPAAIASLLTISRTFRPLSKVLFIFPSRYLFAIGLSPVFSFRWSIPPVWGCIPKQPDSSGAPRWRAPGTHHGIVTLCDAPFQGTCVPGARRSRPYCVQLGTRCAPITNMSWSCFTRRYWRNPG